MNLDEAMKINQQLTACGLRLMHAHPSPSGPMPDLPDVPLEQMLIATRMVRDHRDEDGRVEVVCADRLVAAMYVLENHEPSQAPIVHNDTHGVAVLPLRD